MGVKKSVLVVLFCLFTISLISVAAHAYYADLQISIDETGLATLQGVSNAPAFDQVSHSTEFTNKQGKLWSVVIADYESYERFVIELQLPEYAVIKSIESSSRATIYVKDNRPTINMLGVGESIELRVEYEMHPPRFNEVTPISFFTGLVVSIVIFLVVVFGGSLVLRNTIRKIPYPIEAGINAKIPHIDFRSLTKRQEEIVVYLQKHSQATQVELSDKLQMPKAAVSRNVHALERRKIVEILPKGMSTVIVLAKPRQKVSDGRFSDEQLPPKFTHN